MRERLYRSRTDRVLFGVAGGMADWLDIDPSVVRLVWAILVLFGGAGLLLYIVAALVIPEEPYEMVGAPPVPGAAAASSSSAPGTAEPTGGGAAASGTPSASGWQGYADDRAARRAARAARRAERGNTPAIVFGIILVLIGGWFLLKDLLPWLDDRWIGPGVLVLIGVLLVVAAVRRPAPHA